jgi:hypothetical protein
VITEAIYYDQDHNKNSEFKKDALKLRAVIYLEEGKIK